MRRLRRLYNRARPDENEVNILRGILTATQEYLQRNARGQ
jgi:tRNA C32,U32 (ribose-2'-O)-methylase TrmJ